jgi:hypothetical protein
MMVGIFFSFGQEPTEGHDRISGLEALATCECHELPKLLQKRASTAFWNHLRFVQILVVRVLLWILVFINDTPEGRIAENVPVDMTSERHLIDVHALLLQPPQSSTDRPS